MTVFRYCTLVNSKIQGVFLGTVGRLNSIFKAVIRMQLFSHFTSMTLWFLKFTLKLLEQINSVAGNVFTSCDFEDGFCGWTNRNWRRTEFDSPLKSTGPENAYHGRAFVFDLLICLFYYYFFFYLISHYDMRENILIVIISIDNRHLC